MIDRSLSQVLDYFSQSLTIKTPEDQTNLRNLLEYLDSSYKNYSRIYFSVNNEYLLKKRVPKDHQFSYPLSDLRKTSAMLSTVSLSLIQKNNGMNLIALGVL